MKVIWAEKASLHLIAIFDYIAQDSKLYARKLVNRILARSRQIGKFPESGSLVQPPDVREVLVGSYRVIYRIETGRVLVVAVIHAARSLNPSDLENES